MEDGVEQTDNSEFSWVHGNFEYRFVSEQTRSRLCEQPERYEIQLGGACARMGALSGVGRTEFSMVSSTNGHQSNRGSAR